MFYNDEHALTLGVRSVAVKTASGTTTTDYPVSSLLSDPGSVTNAQTGTNELTGDQSGLDQSLRPMWPVLFVTDVTADPSSRSGDWQMGGMPYSPTAVFGSWKAAVRTVDTTVSPATVAITPDADPAKNSWNLGTGSDPVPTGLTNEGFGAEVRWDVSLTPGHSYRFQAIVHDGDQNKVGGDSGEACLVYCTGGACAVGDDRVPDQRGPGDLRAHGRRRLPRRHHQLPGQRGRGLRADADRRHLPLRLPARPHQRGLAMHLNGACHGHVAPPRADDEERRRRRSARPRSGAVRDVAVRAAPPVADLRASRARRRTRPRPGWRSWSRRSSRSRSDRTPRPRSRSARRWAPASSGRA